MPQKRHTVDQIVAKLRKSNVELGKGKKVPAVCKLLELRQLIRLRFRGSSTGESRAHGATAELAKTNSVEFKTRLEIAIGIRPRYHQPRCQQLDSVTDFCSNA